MKLEYISLTRFKDSIKRYWWVILICLVIGIIISVCIDRLNHRDNDIIEYKVECIIINNSEKDISAKTIVMDLNEIILNKYDSFVNNEKVRLEYIEGTTCFNLIVTGEIENDLNYDKDIIINALNTILKKYQDNLEINCMSDSFIPYDNYSNASINLFIIIPIISLLIAFLIVYFLSVRVKTFYSAKELINQIDYKKIASIEKKNLTQTVNFICSNKRDIVVYIFNENMQGHLKNCECIILNQDCTELNFDRDKEICLLIEKDITLIDQIKKFNNVLNLFSKSVDLVLFIE